MTSPAPNRQSIAALSLRNVRGFRKLDLSLAERARPPRDLSVIIGRNGTGKSTLLRSVALALAPESDAAALLSAPTGSFIAERANQATIRLELYNHRSEQLSEVELVLKRAGRHEILDSRNVRNPQDASFVCGYGMSRSNTQGKGKSRYRVMDSVETLFYYDRDLVDAELVLRRMRDFLGTRGYADALRGIKRALGLNAKHRIHLPKGGGVEIGGPGIGKRIPLSGWADGYRMSFAWLIDLFGWGIQAEAVARDGELSGILLIDEVAQHLHPSMQAELLPQLRKALPGLQILATTHSPMVAQSVQPEELVPLHRRGHAVVVKPAPDLTADSAEDVLVSPELFGTDPFTRKARSQLSAHKKLMAIPSDKRSERDKQRLRKLAQELRPTPKGDDPVLAELHKLREKLKG